jgi:hypothetical protein
MKEFLTKTKFLIFYYFYVFLNKLKIVYFELK